MAKHHRSASPAPVFVPFPASPWPNGPALDSIARTGDMCGKAFQALSEEAVRFTQARLERDGEFGRQFVACRDWSDAAALQRDWLATAAQDYVEEANRMFQLAADLGGRMSEPPPVAPESSQAAVPAPRSAA